MSRHKISISCGKCGSDKFEFPEEPQPDDMLTCNGCGATARFKDFKESTVDQTVDQIADIARKCLQKAVVHLRFFQPDVFALSVLNNRLLFFEALP